MLRQRTAGHPADAYAKLARLAAAAGLPAIVDATGPLLAAALDGGVAVVCPNLAEARILLGPETGEQVETDPDRGRDEAAQAARALVDRGAAAAIVTAGALGAAVAHAGTVTWVAAPTVEVVNGIGAGDCLVAATAVAMGDGATWSRRPWSAWRRARRASRPRSVARSCPTG